MGSTPIKTVTGNSSMARVSDIRKGKTVTKTYTIKNAKMVDLTDKRDTATSFSKGINGSDWTVNFNDFRWSTLTSTDRK